MRFWALFVLLAWQADAKPPELTSAFPLGVPRDKAIEVTVRGDSLDSIRSVSFDCAEIEGRVMRASRNEAVLTIRTLPGAVNGFHTMRVAGPAGMSGALAISIYAPSTNDSFFDGKLSKPGETGRFTIEGRKGHPVSLEVITGSALF